MKRVNYPYLIIALYLLEALDVELMGRCKVVTDTGKTCGQKAYFFCKICSVHGENETLFLHVWAIHTKSVLLASVVYAFTHDF